MSLPPRHITFEKKGKRVYSKRVFTGRPLFRVDVFRVLRSIVAHRIHRVTMDNGWLAGWIVHWPDRFFFSPPFTGHRVVNSFFSLDFYVGLGSIPLQLVFIAWPKTRNAENAGILYMGDEGESLVKIRV